MITSILTRNLYNQHGRLILWVPVIFGAGIGFYFSAENEPSIVAVYALITCSVMCLLLVRTNQPLRTVLWSIVAISSVGYSYAALRTQLNNSPTLERHYYGPIYGRIIDIDRSSSNSPRITMDSVYLPSVSVSKTPEKIRITLHGYIPVNTIVAGGQVALTGSISPPGAPVEPEGFDFRRVAFFLKLGGVGYTRNPVLPADVANTKEISLKIFAARMYISGNIKSRLTGQNGAFAAAIIAGDRSDINPEVLNSLRASNLAHLLAISGLHMGLLSGFIFALFRYGLALIPYVSLRFSTKKMAAGIAIIASCLYLLLSGSSVATQRAFIMSTVVLVAVILDRPALTLRSVALAALIVLLLKPYGLLEAGFQMSFAATTSLISAYNWLQTRNFWRLIHGGNWKYIKPVLVLLFTSFVAGAATAPISAFHFNQVSQFGLAANFLAVPIMSLVVMPNAVLAALAAPLNLEFAPLWIMGQGIGLILEISSYFSGLDGAVIPIKSGPTILLSLAAISGLIFTIWVGAGRLLGIALFALAIFIWQNYERPHLFVGEKGRVFGLLLDNGRVINKSRGNGYGVNIWLENDGDNITQIIASSRDGLEYKDQLEIGYLRGGWRVVLFRGENPNVVSAYCTNKTILVVSILSVKSEDCTLLDRNYFRNSGAISVDIVDDQPHIKRSRDAARNRPWGG